MISFVSATHRSIAPDLIGMGHSGKSDLDDTFQDHARHLDAFVDALGLTEITLVGHDLGAALAWDFARRHPDVVVRLAFMEGLLPPAFPQASYEVMGEEMGDMFRDMRDPEQGRQMIMEDNMFVEGILPIMVNRQLGDAAAAECRAPYETVESRLPTWMWPREVPIGGEPASSVQLLNDISTFMGETEMPVLLAYAEPDALVPPQAVPFYTGLIDDLETAFVGQGLHFIQEDQPVAIGPAISDWLRRNCQFRRARQNRRALGRGQGIASGYVGRLPGDGCSGCHVLPPTPRIPHDRRQGGKLGDEEEDIVHIRWRDRNHSQGGHNGCDTGHWPKRLAPQQRLNSTIAISISITKPTMSRSVSEISRRAAFRDRISRQFGECRAKSRLAG